MSTRVRINIIKDKGFVDDWDVLWLKPGAPPELIRAAYHALSVLYHPDKHGGDGRAQRLLNEAYQRLMEGL